MPITFQIHFTVHRNRFLFK